MRKASIAIVCVVAVVGAGVIAFWKIDRTIGKDTRELSKMMSVRTTTSPALTAYFKEHGRYPTSLSELPLQSLPWGDEGSSPKDRDAWHYVSDGQTFTLTWKNGSLDLFLGGKGDRLFNSKDEQR